MVELILFPIIIILFGYMGWFQLGAVILVLFGINSLLGAYKAYRNPDWYRFKRAMAFKDPAYMEADESVIQKDIQSLLFTKIIVSIITTVAAIYFIIKAGWL
ncbi:MAG TPA: hypothetical protein VG519_11405 [Pseudochrobactrum sp.]|nr:hypothetical protein [Pseudochrobactrum sp.]